jgi:prolipoprotein diacylglyceryltransferase
MITTFVLCRRGGKVSFFNLCEVVIIPAFLSIALGRLGGCFFAGCCVGVQSLFPLAVNFPYDAPSVTRHATQVYYSLSAAVILLSLFSIEKWLFRRGRGQYPPRAILTPLGLMLYSIMRITIDPLRLNFDDLLLSNIALAAIIPIEAVWLLSSWRAFRKKNATL